MYIQLYNKLALFISSLRLRTVPGATPVVYIRVDNTCQTERLANVSYRTGRTYGVYMSIYLGKVEVYICRIRLHIHCRGTFACLVYIYPCWITDTTGSCKRKGTGFCYIDNVLLLIAHHCLYIGQLDLYSYQGSLYPVSGKTVGSVATSFLTSGKIAHVRLFTWLIVLISEQNYC